MGSSGQTRTVWLKGGAAASWSAECKKALVACGIDPENFGTYSQRADAQGKIRKDYRGKRDDDAKKRGSAKRPHEPGCPKGSKCRCIESEAALKEMGAEDWNEGMSQSGHISQNAFYQAKREDPCSNIPGAPGKHGGGYGYQDDLAFCMDHVGRSTDEGSDHYEITQREGQFKKALQKKGVTVVSMKEIEQGARGTLEIAVKGGDVRINGAPTPEDADRGKISAKRKEKAQLIAKGREANKKALDKKYNKKKTAAKSGKAKGKKPNSPSGKGGLNANEKKAVECIVDAWKQSLDEMRNDLIDAHSDIADKSKACQDEIKKYNNKRPPPKPKAKSYKDLPQDRKDKVNKSKEVRDARTQRMKELKDDHKVDKGQRGKNKKSPTDEECLEYQAHWLANHRASDGGLLPMQGRVPGKSTTKAPDTTRKRGTTAR